MTSTLENVCSTVLKRVTPIPRKRKKVLALAGELKEKVTMAAKKAGVDVKVRVEGSVAKDTWLSGDPEIDIFMQVPTSMSREAFGTICLEIAKEATRGFRQVERFAEHPYLEAYVNSIRVNIVPCYRVEKGEWISATDRTPFHTDYVKPRLSESLCGEVRLLKKFMKGICVYGAEIKVGGFSGYLSELLTLHYKSFSEVLKSFADWKERKLIDYEGYYEGREQETKKIFEEPLIVVDPVDKGRNVASALRRKCLDEFIAASRTFLQNPSLKYFYPPEMKAFKPIKLVEKLEARGSTLIFVTFGKVNAVPDVLWGQLYKSQRSLRGMLQRHDFDVIRSSVWSDEQNFNVFIFEVEHRFLPSIKKHLGPPIEKRKDCEKFLRKHIGSPSTISGPRTEEGRWFVEIKREYTDVANLLLEKLRDGGRQIGIANLISKAISNTFKVYVNREVLKLYRNNTEFAGFLTQFVRGKPHWIK